MPVRGRDQSPKKNGPGVGAGPLRKYGKRRNLVPKRRSSPIRVNPSLPPLVRGQLSMAGKQARIYRRVIGGGF